MIYFCENCNDYFDDEKDDCYREEVEYHDELGSESEHFPERYVRMVCPKCGSEDWELANTCPLCGKATREIDICKDCQEVIKKRVEDLVFELSTGDTKKNQEVIVTWIAENL